MAHSYRRIPTNEINRSLEDDRPRVVSRRRHGLGLLPPIAFRIEPQNLVERRFPGLRFSTEYVNGPAVYRRPGSAARLDRRSRTPPVDRWIVDLDVAKIPRPAASANRVELSIECDGGWTSFRSGEWRAIRPLVDRGIVLRVIGESRSGISSANDVDLSIQYHRRVPALRRG